MSLSSLIVPMECNTIVGFAVARVLYIIINFFELFGDLEVFLSKGRKRSDPEENVRWVNVLAKIAFRFQNGGELLLNFGRVGLCNNKQFLFPLCKSRNGRFKFYLDSFPRVKF